MSCLATRGAVGPQTRCSSDCQATGSRIRSTPSSAGRAGRCWPGRRRWLRLPDDTHSKRPVRWRLTVSTLTSSRAARDHHARCRGQPPRRLNRRPPRRPENDRARRPRPQEPRPPPQLHPRGVHGIRNLTKPTGPCRRRCRAELRMLWRTTSSSRTGDRRAATVRHHCLWCRSAGAYRRDGRMVPVGSG